jgi:sodium-dependent dicarboxylate transporter 2/3/5
MLIGGMMLATAVLSMWVSNTATAVMMLPIAASVVALVREKSGAGDEKREGEIRQFATCLMLGVGYAATIGGVGTLIGTPPNAVLAGYISRTYGDTISFDRWLWIGLPVMLIFLPASWLLLTRVIFPVRLPELPGAREMLRRQLHALGRMSRGEKLVLVIFGLTALAWIFRPQLCELAGLVAKDGKPLLGDSGIAIIGALAMFLTPVSIKRREFVLDWKHAGKMPWGVLLLFGGGLSLAAAFEQHHVDTFVGSMFDGLRGASPLVVVLAMTTAVVFVTEVGSNTAVTNAFLTLVAGVSVSLNIHPYLLAFPIAIGASYAFMMPTGTPPNALVFASGHVRVTQMWRAGIVLNILSIAVITLIVYYLGPWLLGFDPRSIPTTRP